MLERKATHQDNLAEAPQIVHQALSSPGQPLDRGLRDFFAPRFGHDFGNVRVHADGQAAESARAVNARAYTVGRDVVFGAGQYAPHSGEGRRLIAHELAHVVQQRDGHHVNRASLEVGAADDVTERQADEAADAVIQGRTPTQSSTISNAVVQRDLALPPSGVPAPLKKLTAAEIAAAITFNRDRFSDPYSIRVIRDVLGLAPVPAVVDDDLIRAVVDWQAARRMTPQDGKIGHATTRSIYLELVAEGELRDAILLVMDSYRLPEDQRLNNVTVGTGANCCGAAGGSDAVTAGGRECGGGPIEICFCRPLVPTTAADYDHFVRISGHELIHVPQCAAGTGNVDVDEFEAFFFEACSRGRAPQLAAADRVDHANIALGHFAVIPVALRTPARIAMRNQLNALIAAGGAGRC
jgi:hypothetical protein